MKKEILPLLLGILISSLIFVMTKKDVISKNQTVESDLAILKHINNKQSILTYDIIDKKNLIDFQNVLNYLQLKLSNKQDRKLNLKAYKDKIQFGKDFDNRIFDLEKITKEYPYDIVGLDEIINDMEGTYISACARIAKSQQLLKDGEYDELLDVLNSQDNMDEYFHSTFKGVKIKNGAYLLKGLAHSKLGNRTEAINYFQDILENNENSESNKKIIQTAYYALKILQTAENTKRQMSKKRRNIK